MFTEPKRSAFARDHGIRDLSSVEDQEIMAIRGTFGDVFAGKPVLITGHTGFKGSWLSIWLRELGANVIGYSLAPPTTPSNFALSHLKDRLVDVRGDVRDFPQVEQTIAQYRPEVIFHLAAQPLVLPSYQAPKETLDTNVGGTINVAKAASECGVLELHPGPGDLPAERAADVLPQADVVALTGTALVNHTFDDLIELCRPDAFVIVLGGSAPLTPLLLECGVDAVAGTLVVDATAALQTVAQGATFPQIKGKRLLTMSSESTP